MHPNFRLNFYLLHNMAINKKPMQKTSLMSVLWDIQRKRRFISRDDMTKIAHEFDISKMELEGVISFYHFYHRAHSGKYTIYLNNSIISKHKGYASVKKALETEVGVSFGNVSEDKMFGLFETPCIGLSDQETSAESWVLQNLMKRNRQQFLPVP